MRVKPPYRIHMAIPPDSAYWRQVIMGIRQYGFDSGRIEINPPSLAHESNAFGRSISGAGRVHGIIAAAHTHRMERDLLRLRIPALNVSNALRDPKLTVITQDDVLVGRLAGEHLRDCGFRRFVFWGQVFGNYSHERQRGFEQVVAKCGTLIDRQEMRAPFGWSQYLRMLAWLRRQTPPFALFAVSDLIASTALRAARELKWRVPEDMAVLGADDDEFFSSYESPPLSSVRTPAKKVGYEAAAEMDRLLSGKPARTEPIRVPPPGLRVRQSTDILHVDDVVVAKAVRFIRNHPTANPYIGEIVKAAGVSRSLLKVRFQSVLGRSMLREVQMVRVERAKQLLVSTDLTLDTVAERCGFPNSQRFSVLFAQLTGTSPGRFRRERP
ncbi:MAG TPA: substrate-binding domain-containing protein [Lacunisphaera sp.]|nr:substrate-binding domain-containing protein [Lacunisphaera sp.]